MTRSMKEMIDKLELIPSKTCALGKMVKRIRRQAIDWENIFAKDTFDKGLLSKIDKEVLELNNSKQIT